MAQQDDSFWVTLTPVFETFPEPVLILDIRDTEDIRVLKLNAMARKQTGLENEQDLPADARRFLSADFLEEIVRSISYQEVLEIPVTDPMGPDDPPKLYLARVVPAKNNLQIVSFRLLNVDALIQKRISALERRCRVMAHASPQTQIIADADGRILMANDAAVKTFGCKSIDELRSHRTWDFYTLRDVRERVLEKMRRHYVINLRITAKRVTGEAFPALLSGARIILDKREFFWGHLVDLSENEALRVKLSQNEEQLHHIFESMDDGMLLVGDDNICKIANRSFMSLFNIEEPDFIGLHLDEVAKIAPCEALTEALASCYRTSGPTPEDRIIQCGQSKKKIEIRCRKTNDGTLIQFRDVTERENHRDQHVRLQKMEAVRDVTYRVAHDFNNLLGPLIGVPAILRLRVQGNPGFDHLIELVTKSVTRLSEMNQKLLGLSRSGSYVFETINLNDVIRMVVELFERPARVSLEFTPCGDPLMITGDEKHLINVIRNLLNNAIQSMPDTGHIRIGAVRKFVAEETRVAFGLLPQGEYVEMSVSDSGCGIDPSEIPRLVELFYTGDNPRFSSGMGIGLYYIQEIVTDHGGYLHLDSSLESGTSLRLYFPAIRSGDTPPPSDQQ